MLLRNHAYSTPGQTWGFLGAAGALIPKGLELAGLIIKTIHPAYPAGINIALSWGTDNCLWTKIFREVDYEFASGPLIPERFPAPLYRPAIRQN